jgi:hypothetical protein
MDLQLTNKKTLASARKGVALLTEKVPVVGVRASEQP